MLLIVAASNFAFAQESDENEREIFYRYMDNCYSDEDCQPCMDTLKILGFKQVNDIGIMLPSWKPVLGDDEVTVLEGRVIAASVTPEDLPLYHYTHDIGINVVPDKDYEHLLTYYTNDDGERELVRDYMHLEWETGLAAGNKGNYCTQFNTKGNSCGFASAGHERNDEIWNWPTVGDWAHIEGLWIFDRGHPPAKTELHPIRFMGTLRSLPDKITVNEKPVFASRVDIYANGDGGAFYNNLPFAEDYVHKVKMSDKDYSFTVKNILPPPSPNAKLKYQVLKRKGNTFPQDVSVKIEGNSAVITVPWKSKGIADTAVLGQTVHLYWDEGNGIPENFKIYTYNVTLDKLRIRRFTDVMNRSEMRMYANVGSNYFFLNDILGGKENILDQKFGKTLKRNWKIKKTFTIYVPEGWRFRIMAKGWEADGTDKIYGHIMDHNSPCDAATKKFIHDKMMDWSPVGLGGCMDDFTGMAEFFHQGTSLGEPINFKISPLTGENGDFCPGSGYDLRNYFNLYYTLERIGN